MTMNREGLTWEEWITAANCKRFEDTPHLWAELKKAWRDGEDPTEYYTNYND